MSTNQPVWKFVANIGDKNPLEYGGLFVYIDETGVYPPECELVEVLDETDDPKYKVYRYILEPCTYINGILSDNKFHPDKPVWFADDLETLASQFEDMTADDLAAQFCSDNVLVRAFAWQLVGQHWGFDELDNYPLDCRKRELRNRYLKMNGEKY